MANKEVKRKIIVFILASAFIANLFISEISNYKPYSFYLKGISTIFLLFVSFIDYKFNKDEKNVLIKIDKKRLTKILLLFLLIPCLSLIYSSNSEFGLIKIVYLLISTLPSSIIFAYLLATVNKKRLDEFLISIISIGILFGLTSLIISPFKPATAYSFKLTRWSHVIGGRFLSSVTVIILLLNFSDLIKSKSVIIVTSTILLISTYFDGLRAAFLGIIIVISTLMIFAIIRKNSKVILSISLSLFFSIVLILLIGKFNSSSTERYNKLLTDNIGNFSDSAINARLIAYETSWKNIKKHPILGVGLGGFNNKEISGDIAKIKYPHNLLIEIQLELGILGTFFFAVLLGFMFWKAYKFSIPLFVFFVFSFWLSMFSKDIATQTQLWIGLGLWGINKNKMNTELIN